MAGQTWKDPAEFAAHIDQKWVDDSQLLHDKIVQNSYSEGLILGIAIGIVIMACIWLAYGEFT